MVRKVEQYRVNSREETVQIASEFAKRCIKEILFAFCGDLGAGKTAFVSGVAKGLDMKAIQAALPFFNE